MKKLMAILLATLLAASALPVLADENVSGSVSDIEAANGQITYKDSTSTTQTISGTEASFEGNVTSTQEGVSSVAISAKGVEFDISVTGDITAAYAGVEAYASTVTVEGAVTLETTGGETKAITFTFDGEEITIEA